MPPTSRGRRPMDHFWDVTCPLLLWARGEDKAGREGGLSLHTALPPPGVASDPSPSLSPSAEGPGSGGATDSTVLPARPPPWEVQWHLSSCRKRGQKAGTGAFWLLHWAMARIWTDSRTPSCDCATHLSHTATLRQRARTPPFQILFSTFPKGTILMGRWH